LARGIRSQQSWRLRHLPLAPSIEKEAKEQQAAWAKHLGVPVEITNSIGMKLVLIPPGEFTMGDGGDAHKVKITKPFLPRQVSGDTGGVGGCAGQGQQPERVQGAEEPCRECQLGGVPGLLRKLNEKGWAMRMGATDYRLKRKWEYACRAGCPGRMVFLATSAIELDDYGWFDKNSEIQ